MSYFVLYRKPQFHKYDFWPWQKGFHLPDDALEFIQDLGEEYETQVYKCISRDKLIEIIENGEEEQ